MQQKFGFTKGMRQSISPNKADPQSYYEALNKRVIVDNKSGTAALTDEPGTRLVATIPATSPVYTIELDGSVDDPNSTVTFSLTSGDIDIDVTCGKDMNLVYSILMADATLALAIAAGDLYVGLKGNKVVVVYLNDTTGGLAEVGDGLTVTTVVPSITDAEIIATGSIREDLILFTRSTTYGQIWKCRYNDSGNIDALTPNDNLIYNGVMYPSLTDDYQIYDVVGRYDNENLVKVYWSNCVDNLNHINIADKDSLLLPIELLSISPDCTLNQPKVNNVLSGGMYYAGMVQYGYQLYNLYGAETVISPLSGLIHLTESNSTASSSMSYKGTENGKQAGKAVSITINDIDPRYDFIKVIAVYYTSEEGEPEVNVIAERNIPTSKSITVIDGGDTVLSVYTPAQLSSIGTRIFTPKLLTVKDNILLAGNIVDKYFDVDTEIGAYWDARAYRFNNASESQIKYDGGSYETVSNTFLIGGESIPEDHDCHLDKEAQRTFKYKADGLTMGGSGINISYNFFVRSIMIDDLTTTKQISTTAVASSRQKWGDSTNMDYIEEGYLNNSSFSNYASPINQSEIVGYQRDEMYRFGIVFFDGKGRQSFNKWIADIKMPTNSDTDNNVYLLDQVTRLTYDNHYDIYFNCSDGSGTYANVLGINFTVDTSALPDDWTFAITRVRREDIDRTIVGQGTVIPGIWNEYKQYIQGSFKFSVQDMTYYDAQAAESGGILFFYSPELKFSNDYSKASSDKIRFISTADTSENNNPFPASSDNWKSYKWPTAGRISYPSNTKTVTDSIRTSVGFNTYTVNVGATTTRVSNSVFFDDSGDGVYDFPYCYCGSNLLIALEDSDPLGYTNNVIVNYEKEVLNQYGGFNYNAKLNNSYMLVGKIRSCNGSYTSSRVFGGDTFIEIFDFLATMRHRLTMTTGIDVGDYQHKSAVYLPVETTINLALRHDTCPSKDGSVADSAKLMETIDMGNTEWPEGNDEGGAYPSNFTDLYLYNRVYSRQPNSKTYVGKPLNFRLVQDKDCDVTSSEKHISGELVDSWTKFLFNNKLTVNSSNGPLSKLLVFRNQVMFWQDKAFGLFSFNDRKVLKDENGTSLILGVGSVLEYFQYISEKSGTKFTRSVIDSGVAIYYYDDTNHKLMMTQGGAEESISDIADCAPIFKGSEFDNPVDVVGVFDKSTRRVLITVKDEVIASIPEYTITTIKYGALYNWYAATDERLICADGWGVPEKTDWDTLATYLGGALIAGGKLKEMWLSHWLTPNTGATNEVSFNARPSSGRRCDDGTFNLGDTSLTFIFRAWSNDKYLYECSYISSVLDNNDWTGGESEGSAIRPMRLATESELLLDDGLISATYTGNDGKVYRCTKIGTQVWVADNLAETKFRNGDDIPIVTDNAEWAALETAGMCVYNNDWDNAFTEVVIPEVPASYTGLTIGFNERLQAFESNYSYVPNLIFSHDGKLLAIDYLTPDELYEHNYEPSPNKFYGQSATEGYVTIVAGSDDKKVFTNVEFNSVSSDGTTEYPLATVDNMKLHNSYLESTKIPLTSSNLRRRFRTWRLQLPKTVEVPSGKSRYMDYYLGLTLYNTPTNNANLRLEDVTIYYLIPIL